MYIKKMSGVDADLVLLGERNDHHHEELNSLKRKQKRQERFNCQMEERMQVMEGTIEDQAERVVALEEEDAVLRMKKVCKCGKVEALSAGSGTQEDLVDVNLEYADEEGSSSGGSYHAPPRVAEEPLLVFGSPITCLRMLKWPGDVLFQMLSGLRMALSWWLCIRRIRDQSPFVLGSC